MKVVIDTLETSTGWTGTGTITAINTLPDYIAGNLAGSIVVSFGAVNQSITKTYNVDLSGCEMITISAWARHGVPIDTMNLDAVNAPYAITLNGSTSFYLPISNSFEPINLRLPSGFTTLTSITLSQVSGSGDYLIFSNILGVKDELPLDIFVGVKEQIDNEISKSYSRLTGGVNGSGILIGTISASSGATYINFPASLWLQRYTVITITDGTNIETHQVIDFDETKNTFGASYDGVALKNSYTNASVYVIIPCVINPSEKEISLPSVSVWGLSAEELPRETKVGQFIDSFTLTGSARFGYSPLNMMYAIQIDAESRQNELLAFISYCVRRVLGREFIWVTGKKINIRPKGAPTPIDPVEGYNEIPKLVFNAEVEIREDLIDSIAPTTTTNTHNYIITGLN